VVVSFLVNGNNPTIVPTPSAGTLLDGAGTNVGQTSLHLIGGTAGSPVTLNGTWPTASYSGQVVLCMH
jgi:hypothetical protein